VSWILDPSAVLLGKVYEDFGISGAKGRDRRPAFDALLKDSSRREFDIIAVWSSDRLGRSLSHLVEVLQTISATGVGLYIHTQALDTTTPSGRALFQMLGVFERASANQRRCDAAFPCDGSR
jgi:DNA invertase Pin-like site-specific DNA recombinase